MPSDEKRREVARRLRRLRTREFADGVFCDIGDIVDALGIEQDDELVRFEDVEQLVDLIEPQADLCWDVSGYQDVFECSECRCKVELIAEDGNEYGETFNVPLMPSFCPNCGRGIVRVSKR